MVDCVCSGRTVGCAAGIVGGTGATELIRDVPLRETGPAVVGAAVAVAGIGVMVREANDGRGTTGWGGTAGHETGELVRGAGVGVGTGAGLSGVVEK